MEYFISQGTYNLVNNCKLRAKDLNIRTYIDKIRFDTRFLWKYRHILDWKVFTKFLKTETQLKIFDKFILKTLITATDISDQYVQNNIDQLNPIVMFAKKRPYNIIMKYLEFDHSDAIAVLVSQNLTPGIILKCRQKSDTLSVLRYIRNLQPLLVEYLIMTDSKIGGRPSTNTKEFNLLVEVALKNHSLDKAFLQTHILTLTGDNFKVFDNKEKRRHFVGGGNRTLSYDTWVDSLKLTSEVSLRE